MMRKVGEANCETQVLPHCYDISSMLFSYNPFATTAPECFAEPYLAAYLD